MIVRFAMGLGLIALSYYVGREVGRTEHWRNEERRRRSDPLESIESEEYVDGTDPFDDSAGQDRDVDS